MSRGYGPDELRESWCFLLLVARDDGKQPRVVGWAVGCGNADQLLETEQRVDTELRSEAEILTALGTHLDTYRYQDTTLLTPTAETLRLLRARFLATDELSSPTFRGYRHVALTDLIHDYVDCSATDFAASTLCEQPLERTAETVEETDLASLIERFWQVRTDLGPLLPARALRGEPV